MCAVDTTSDSALWQCVVYSAFVAGTFLFGWLLGLASVFKLWQLSHAPRWLVLSGDGLRDFDGRPMLSGCAVLVVRRAGWRRAAGGRASLALAGLACLGLVAGLLVL